jgi:uncharacterized YccA/Bax inhibitor family protein
MKDTIVSILTDRPSIGIAAGFLGGMSAVLSLFQIITVVAGVLGAVFGMGAAFFTLLIKYREWKRGEKKNK